MSDTPLQFWLGGIQTNRTTVGSFPTIARGQLSGSSATLYTAPSTTTPLGSTQYATVKLWLCNTDTVDRTVTIYLIESGGSVADNRAILKDATIAAKQSIGIEFGAEGFTLESGETLRGLASSANVVTYRVEAVQRQ